MKRIFFILFAFALAPSLHAAMGHDHSDRASAPAAPCSDREAPASLACALTVSGTFDAKGRLWVAWAFGGHVYVNRSADHGATFSAPMPVNRIPERVSADGENRPKLALGPHGELYVAWTLRLDKPYSGHIRFARSTDGGNIFSDPITVNDHLEVTSHRFESLAVNERGEIYLAWLDKRDLLAAQKAGAKYAGAAVYYARSTDGGRTFEKNRKIADHSCECCRTAMTLDERGLPVIAWRQIYGDNVRDHAIVHFTAANKPGDAVRLSHDEWRVEACPHHGPALYAADGFVHAVWFDNAPERHGLFYAHSESAGGFSEPLGFGNYDQNASHPHVAAVGRNVYLAWMEFDGQKNQVRVASLTDGGNHFGTPRVVAETEGRADYPMLMRDGTRIYLSWLTTNEGFRIWPLNPSD